MSFKQSGFTLLEVVITVFIIGTVVAGMFGLFLLTLRSAQTGERRVAAVALANERMEMVRNLPYVEVGTQGGVPSGPIWPEEAVARNGQTYTVRTDIRYVDDPYDGSIDGESDEEEMITICHKPGTPAEATLEVPAPALDAHLAHGDTTGACGSQGEGTPPGDEYNADYKQVRVEVSWPNQYEISPVLLITYVAPQGIEGGELGGTLDFHVFHADGEAVAGATLEIVNDEVDPAIAISTQTNAEGRVVLPGLPPASDSYELSVTKNGYTHEQTYAASATFLPLPDYSHMSMIIKEVTQKTFFIDEVASVAVQALDEAEAVVANLAYRLHGTKSIGIDDDEQPVYKVDENGTTNVSGQFEHANLDWDTYDISIDGATTGWDIKESSVVLPLTLVPAEDLAITIKLAPHTEHSLHITVVDSEGVPVDNATVQVTGPSVDVTQDTGVWGQLLFRDLSLATFQVTVAASGFEPSELAVAVNGTTRLQVEVASSL